MSSQQFSLRWNNYINHITGAFDSLRSDEDLVDVTLSCEGKRIRAHKMLLSACSTYFKDLFKENPCPHPVIIFRNVKFEDLVALIDFMYQGEVNVVQDQLASFLTTAELLAVQGLSEGGYKGADICEEPNSPALPPEPEIQMSSSSQVHSQQESCSSSASVASPMSYLALDHEPESPCAKRRKKSSSSTVKSISTGDVKGSERESNTERNFISNKSNGDSNSVPPEIIPVIPNLKVEMPEYVQRELQSCDYGDANQSISNMTGGQDIKTDGLSLSHNVQSRESKDNTEPPDMFCLNSRDSSVHLPSESLSTSDVGQVLSKPGTSGERQVQDSLQDHQWVGGTVGRLQCSICGKLFHNRNSLSEHRNVHVGKTQCPVCPAVLSRIRHVKRHLITKHGWSDLQTTSVKLE